MTNSRQLRNSSSGRRLHIVLIPGFAGFDALGQLDYYAGVTAQFRRWQFGGTGRRHVVLHYFDNFPTAAVVTRARRLRQYLAKRIARREILPEDSLALVGHSTGGLDIRRLLWDLGASPDQKLPIDGAEIVQTGQILALVDRVIFMSTPQWGTNIAAWVRENVLGRALVVAQLRTAVAASQVPLLNMVQDWISSSAASILDVDLLHAVQDALREAESGTSDDPMRVAMAQEAASELELWLRHMASDYRVIDDLSPPGNTRMGDADTGSTSPAHFTPALRVLEMAKWEEYGIRTRSYATVSRRPFRFETGRAAPPWELLKPWTWPDCTESTSESAGTSLVYRYCYRACAGGPFTYPESDSVPMPTPFGNAERRTIESWDNDGIVNTASMLWPAREQTLLVECDHEDIVGHYERVEACNGTGRKYRAYDLLESASGFGEAMFASVWNDIFDFCVSVEAHTHSFSAGGR